MAKDKELEELRKKTLDDLSQYGHWSADEKSIIVDLLVRLVCMESALKEIQETLIFIKLRG